MSSHREAPEISKDPVADSTDVYAFVSPDKPDTVTLIANYVPLQSSRRRPELLRVRRRRAVRDPHRQRRRRQAPMSRTSSGSRPSPRRRHVPLQHRPDPVAGQPNWNRRQSYTVTRDVKGSRTRHAADQRALPAVQHRPLSTPNYVALANAAIRAIGGKVFSGQRAEGFYVDLGAVFDLATCARSSRCTPSSA